jgi:hypothetical protein
LKKARRISRVAPAKEFWMLFSSAVIGSAFAAADFLAVVLPAVSWALLMAAAGVVVLAADDSADVCSFADAVVVPVVVSAAVLSAVVVAVELLETRLDFASGRCDVPADAVDGATVRLADDGDFAADDVPSAAVDVEVGDFGPRAVWAVAFFEDPELDVAELDELDELWSVSSALATATTGPASDNPNAKAATPARAPR